MPTVFKLTSQSNQTYDGFLWEPSIWHEVSGTGALCTDGWLHAYSDPLVAVFMNPSHAAIENPKLWEAEAEGQFKDDHGLKCGYSRMRVVREIELPEISMEQRVEIAINCAIIAGCDDENWIAWALHWMDGSDRSEEAAWTAWAAAGAVWAAAGAAERAAEMVEDFNLPKLIHEVCDKH